MYLTFYFCFWREIVLHYPRLLINVTKSPSLRYLFLTLPLLLLLKSPHLSVFSCASWLHFALLLSPIYCDLFKTILNNLSCSLLSRVQVPFSPHSSLRQLSKWMVKISWSLWLLWSTRNSEWSTESFQVGCRVHHYSSCTWQHSPLPLYL